MSFLFSKKTGFHLGHLITENSRPSILNDFGKFINYGPEQTHFNLFSSDYKFHTAGKKIKHLLEKYDPNGVLSVLYARSIFEEAMKEYHINYWKLLTDPGTKSDFIEIQDMYNNFHGPDVEMVLHEYMRDMNRLVEQTCDIKLIENSDPDDKSDENTFIKSIVKVTEDLDKCRTDIYLKSDCPIDIIDKFNTKILVFERMADCVLSLSSQPDAIYLCYINQNNTADGYFAFVIKNNGNIFSINDRIPEHYIGEHQNHRNSRWVKDHAGALFPYNFIFKYSNYDHKGYATTYNIENDKLDFVHLEPHIYQPLLLAMILLKRQWEGCEINGNTVFINTLLPENINQSIDSAELALYENHAIVLSHREYQPNLDPDKIITGEYNERFKMHNIGQLWVDLYGDGFQPDFSNLLSSQHLIEDQHTKKTETKTYTEYLGSQEDFDREMYRKLRIQLADYIREKMKKEAASWTEERITEFMREKFLAKKEEFLDMICENYFITHYLKEKSKASNEVSRNELIRKVRIETDVTYYCSSSLNNHIEKDRQIKKVYDDNDMKKCSISGSLTFNNWKEIECFIGEKLPNIFQGWQDHHPQLGYNGNNILSSTDAVGDICHPFYSKFPYQACHISMYFSKKSWKKMINDWMIRNGHQNYLDAEQTEIKLRKKLTKEREELALQEKKNRLLIPFENTKQAKDLYDSYGDYTNYEAIFSEAKKLYQINPDIKIGSISYKTQDDGKRTIIGAGFSIKESKNQQLIEEIFKLGWKKVKRMKAIGGMYITFDKCL